MTQKNLKTFLILVGAVAVFSLCWQVYTNRAIAFFQDALRSEHIEESVSVAGKTYTVSNGVAYEDGKPLAGARALKVLELAYAKVLARRSPYLALAGVDPDALDEATTELAQTQNGFAELQKDASSAAAVRSALYPVDFLHHAARAERARLAFIASGSDTDYGRYILQQHEAMRAYEHDLAAFKNTFEKIVPSNTKNYADSAYIISRDGIVHALEALQNGIEETQTKVSQRKRCIAGMLYACDVAQLRPAALMIPQERKIPASSLRTAEDINSLIKTAAQAAAEQKNIPETRLVGLSKSACTEKISDAPLFRLVAYAGFLDDYSSRRPYFVGDIRFEKVSDDTQTAFHTFFTDHGVTYVPSNPLTHYTCLALDTDLSRVFIVRNTAVFAHESPVSNFVSGPAKQTLLRLEARLTTGVDSLQESDAVAYVAAAQEVAAAAALPPPTLNTIESLSLQIQNNSAGFDDFVRDIARTELSNIEITKKDGVPVALAAPYLFYARSAFLGLFMSANSSMVGALGATLPPNTVPLSEQPFEFYSTMAHTPQLRDAIVHDLSAYFRLHIEAVL